MDGAKFKIPQDTTSQEPTPISGHRWRDQWMLALAAASGPRNVGNKRDKGLPQLALRLTLILCKHYNCTTRNLRLTRTTLEAELRASRATVYRAIALLREPGWIGVSRDGDNFEFVLLIPSEASHACVRQDESHACVRRKSDETSEAESLNFGGFSSHTVCDANEPENLKEVSKKESKSAPPARRSEYGETLSLASDIPGPASGTDALTLAPDSARETQEQLRSTDRVVSPCIELGTPATKRARRFTDAVALKRFQMVKQVYPPDRIGDEAEAFAAFRDADHWEIADIVGTVRHLIRARGENVPSLAETMATVRSPVFRGHAPVISMEASQ